ncbi:MAG: putative CRISPR-associated protein [Thermodesulfovibrionales bacterium]
MPKLIITTVGTSIITNNLYGSQFNTEIAQLVERGIVPNKKDYIVNTAVNNILNNLRNNKPNRHLSAELASLRVFRNNDRLGLSKDDVIVLFSTDTEDGKFCSEVNKRVLESLGWCNVLQPVVIQGLKTKITNEGEDISDRFKEAGLVNLKNETERLLKGHTYEEKYFNISGGFKATIPFITILAFEKGMKLFYLYEEGNDLIVIEPPRRFNCSYDDLQDYASVYRDDSELGAL